MSQRTTIEDCKRMAEEKGGRSLSTEYLDSRTKMTWECHRGHQWATDFHHIQQGYWCPTCARDRVTVRNNA